MKWDTPIPRSKCSASLPKGIVGLCNGAKQNSLGLVRRSGQPKQFADTSDELTTAFLKVDTKLRDERVGNTELSQRKPGNRKL